jgi:hypothetical protein
MLPFFSIEQSNQHSSCRNEAGELLNDGTIRLWTRNNITAINFIFASITKKMKENLYTPGPNATQISCEIESTISASNRRTATSTMATILRLQTYSWYLPSPSFIVFLTNQSLSL